MRDGKPYDCLFANISGRAACSAKPMASLGWTAPGGQLVLAGLLRETETSG